MDWREEYRTDKSGREFPPWLWDDSVSFLRWGRASEHVNVCVMQTLLFLFGVKSRVDLVPTVTVYPERTAVFLCL